MTLKTPKRDVDSARVALVIKISMVAVETLYKNTVGKHVFLCFLCNMRMRHAADVALHANRKPLAGNPPCRQQKK